MTLAARRLNPRIDADTLVYRGRNAVGAISQRGREWLALDIDGRKIGRFPTRLAAFSAVLRKGDAR
jgi:hypothetical protein